MSLLDGEEKSAGRANVLPLLTVCRNWDLHVTSSCHRINVYSMNRSRPLTAKRLKMLEAKGLPIVPITHPLEIDLESDEDYEKAMEAMGGRDPKE
jgi:sulfite oxidase